MDDNTDQKGNLSNVVVMAVQWSCKVVVIGNDNKDIKKEDCTLG